MSVVAKPNIKPLGARALVRRVEEDEKQVGGIFIPDSAKEKPQQAEVIAVGPGEQEDGKTTPLPVKEGDRVLLSKYGGTDIKYDGEDYLLVREDDILAIIES
ncbi:co-chaperone GroES [Pelagicoccus sp. SDUM812005]|uniref:co-chaperone GroES n=1 Tax=Pelagicoccus sp. SDUM812005 TaxID=3041257 RepID=UPI00280F7A82|nr:co-chaperone GroES [Pelagicoccus sp. SDUM812005]MDQ8181960.1 co-chaperone GroES [Pelagicoccus sp. SDUM812005]